MQVYEVFHLGTFGSRDLVPAQLWKYVNQFKVGVMLVLSHWPLILLMALFCVQILNQIFVQYVNICHFCRKVFLACHANYELLCHSTK